MRLRAVPFAAAAAVVLAVGCQGGGTAPASDDYMRPMASPIAENPTHPSGESVTSIPLTGRPFGLAVTASGTAIVSQLDRDQVTMIELESMDTLAVEVGSTPTGVAAIGDRWALVTNQYSGDVSIVNVVTRRETSVVGVPYAPFRVIADRAGEMAYATINQGMVMFINLADRQVTRTVSVAHAPNGLAIHGNSLYVSSMTGGIAVIDRTTGAVTRTIPIPGMLQDLAMDRDGRELFVASESDPYIRVVAPATGVVVDSLRTPRSEAGVSSYYHPSPGGTFGLALSPDGEHLYATSGEDLHVFDVGSRSLVRSIRIGGHLRRVAFNGPGTVAVVTDEAGAVHFIK